MRGKKEPDFSADASSDKANEDDKNDIRKYLSGKTEVSLPHMQQDLGLTFGELYGFIQPLIGSGALTFKGGTVYAVNSEAFETKTDGSQSDVENWLDGLIDEEYSRIDHSFDDLFDDEDTNDEDDDEDEGDENENADEDDDDQYADEDEYDEEEDEEEERMLAKIHEELMRATRAINKYDSDDEDDFGDNSSDDGNAETKRYLTEAMQDLKKGVGGLIFQKDATIFSMLSYVNFCTRYSSHSSFQIKYIGGELYFSDTEVAFEYVSKKTDNFKGDVMAKIKQIAKAYNVKLRERELLCKIVFGGDTTLLLQFLDFYSCFDQICRLVDKQYAT